MTSPDDPNYTLMFTMHKLVASDRLKYTKRVVFTKNAESPPRFYSPSSIHACSR
jgi:hypothetical protein